MALLVVRDRAGLPMSVVKRIARDFAGGLFCALIWFAMDRWLFGDLLDLKYYTGVVFAYMAGAGTISKSVEERYPSITPQSALPGEQK